jgi:Serine dehydrogenase proteinase
MPTWSGILNELLQSAIGNTPPQVDSVRRKYLVLLHDLTGRETILYASKFTPVDPTTSPETISIVDEDLQGMMEVTHGLAGTDLDLILHSPGGSLEAAEAIVIYLRSKFSNIRVIVPQLAQSAATMIACASDKIVLGKHSFLGPIDPQLILPTPLGQRGVPAQAVIEQFELATEECKDPHKLGAWLPMLGQFGPDLLIQCRNASALSKELVEGWLKVFMFRDKVPDEARILAASIADWLSSHKNFRSHSRHIPRGDCESHGLSIEPLENDETFQDLVLSIFHATTHAFNLSPAVKIIENHLGKAFIKQSSRIVGTVPLPLPPGVPPP